MGAARSLRSIVPAPTPEEAAAIAAALERFARDTSSPARGTRPGAAVSPWLRAALLEGTGREPDAPAPWGDPHPWGR